MPPFDKCSLDAAAYTPAEAACILGLSASTVRNWSFGQSGRVRKGQRERFQPVIEAADSSRKLLSFANLCELHLLSAIRRQHRITLPVVRQSVRYVQQHMAKQRPLIDVEFRTNGISLFVEQASRLLDVSREGQLALRGDFERALSRIERDSTGNPVRLFPYTRSRSDPPDSLALVAVDPEVAFGRPVLVGAGVKTEVVASRFGAGDEPADMATDYGVPLDTILEALRYEQRALKAA